MIDSLQELAEWFKKLSPETQKTIVVIAGLAAAIGPLLLGIGGIMQLVPVMVAGFATIKGAFLSLTAVMAANPFGAIAVALGAIVSVALIANSRFTELTNATEEFAKITNAATESIAKEKAELEKNLTIAKNDKLSKEERKKAIANLNAISPEYLGNLNLENINTKAATDSVNKYNEALLTKAKVMAAQEKLVDVQKKLLDMQLGQSEAAKPSIWQNVGNALLSYGNSGVFAARTALTTAQNLGTEQQELSKLQNLLISFIGENDKFSKSNVDVSKSINNVTAAAEKLPKAGTIAFYENEISKLQKLQKETITTSDAYFKLEDKIKSFQQKIDAIALKPIEAVKIAPIDTSGALESYLKNSEYHKQMVDTINADSQRMQENQIATNEAMRLRAEELNEAYSMIGESFMGLFQSYSQGFVDSLGITNEGMKAFVQSMIGTITKLISMALSASMANSIQGATQSGTATGPAAVFTTPAFIATAIAGIISAFAAIPKFATGGMVPGTSLYGDKILARVNSGELILNQKQQSNLWGMMNSAGQGVNVNLEGGFRLAGSDLELVIERAVNKNNRKR
jgi:hypothetical protein